MTRKDLKKAYDSVNPTAEEKSRMLENILGRTEVKPETARRQERLEYRAKSAGTGKSRWGGLLAACVALALLGGILAIRLTNDPVIPDTKDPAYSMPTEEEPTILYSAYEETLLLYRKAVTENWSAETCVEKGISSRTLISNEYDGLYYALSDLDRDGVAELIITQSKWEDNRTEFLDIYTLKDGIPILLASDREFLRPMLFENGVIMHTDPGAGNSNMQNYACYLRIEGEIFVMETATYQTEDGQWYEWTPENLTAEKITQERAGEIAALYRRAELDFIPLIPESETVFQTGVEAYDAILPRYVSALNGGWTEEQCEEADISITIPDAGPDLGWCVMDLDFNGIKELIIADSEKVYDIYTLMPEDGAPVHILTDMATSYSHILENGMLRMQELYSKGCAWIWMELDGVELTMADMVAYANAEGENQYLYGPDGSHLEPIEKDAAGEYINRWRDAVLDIRYFNPLWEKTAADREEYQQVLDTYGRALGEDWNPGQCMDNGISLMVGYRGELYDSLGVAFLDLDGNGTEELLITDGNVIFDLYTIIDDEEYGPVRLLTGTERSNYYLMEDNVIHNTGSGSAAVRYYTYYLLEGRELKLIEGYMFDGEEAPENPWFYYDGENIGDRCPDMSPNEIINFGYKQVYIPFIPFED